MQRTGIIEHPRDVEYFTEYPEPVMEMIHSLHHTNINSTIPYFGPMLYFLCRALGCEKVLEIGHAEGYTSFYLAHAVKDNAQRFQMAGNMYYGIDIVQTEKVREALTVRNLPNTIVPLDSMLLLPSTFGVQFDLIFQDGCHDAEHVVHEFNTMFPTLKPGGYWIAHDASGPAEEGWHQIIKERRFQFDALRFLCVYGLGVIHKTEGLDPEKRYWCP